MPVPAEIGLLSTRVDSYRQPIDSQTTPFQPPKTHRFAPVCNRLKPSPERPPIDMGRQLSTGVDRCNRVENRHFLRRIRWDPGNALRNIKNHRWPPNGMGFAEPHPKRRSVSSPCVNHYKSKGYDLVNVLPPSLCFFPVPVPLLSVTGNSGTENSLPFPRSQTDGHPEPIPSNQVVTYLGQRRYHGPFGVSFPFGSSGF